MSNEQQLLKQAAQEISQLRNQNYIMSLRLNMFDDMMTLFKTRLPQRGFENNPDILHQIQKKLSEPVIQTENPSK